MQRIWSVDLPTHVGERVALVGWLHRLRRLSNLAFLILRDGQGLAQIIVDAPEQIEVLAALPPESVRHAAARRLRAGPGALGGAPGGSRQRA
jgi:nondiscriminating aspartyl-tRNA synthetase